MKKARKGQGLVHGDGGTCLGSSMPKELVA